MQKWFIGCLITVLTVFSNPYPVHANELEPITAPPVSEEVASPIHGPTTIAEPVVEEEVTTTAKEETPETEITPKTEVTPETEEPAVEEEVTTPSNEENITPTIDLSNEVKTDGIHVKIRYADYFDGSYIPSMVIEHRTAEGKTISTVAVGEQNFDKQSGTFSLVFPNPGYKKGETYQLYVKSLDPAVKHVTMVVQYLDYEPTDEVDGVTHKEVLVSETTTLKQDNYFTFTIQEVEYAAEDEASNDYIRDLEPSAIFPLTGGFTFKEGESILFVTDTNGNPVKNEKLTIRTGPKGSFDVVTDNAGAVRLSTSKLGDTFTVIPHTKKIPSSPNNAYTFESGTKHLYEPYPTYRLTVSEANALGQGVSIISKINGSAEISSRWAQADIVLTDKDGKATNVTISKDTVSLPLTDGTYTVQATSDTANLQLSASTIQVKNGKATLTVTMTPKFVLEVHKDGEAYQFQFVNVPEFQTIQKGKKTHTFAVTPGEVYTILDVDTNQTHVVSIDSNSPVTSLHLGLGTYYGGTASTPHTGTAQIYLWVLGFGLVLLAGILIARPPLRRRVIHSSLAVILVSSLFLPNLQAVQASDSGIGSGKPGDTSVGTSTPPGNIQTSKTVSLVQVTFTNGEVYHPRTGTGALNKDSIAADFMEVAIDSPYLVRNSFFIASDMDAYNIAKRPNTAFAKFDNNAIVPIFGTTPFTATPHSGTSASNQAKYGINGTFQDRVLLPAEEILASSNPNAFDHFIATTVKSMSSTPTRRYIWNGDTSSSHTNYGDVVSTEYVENYTKDSKTPDGANSQEALFKAFEEKLVSIGQADTVQQLWDNMNESPEKKKNHIFLFQTVQAFYIVNQQGHMVFMPMDDAMEWYLWGRTLTNSSYGKYHHRKAQEVVSKIPQDAALNSAYAKKAPTSTYLWNIKKTSSTAIKPKSDNIPILANPHSDDAIQKNPFLGWGFVNWGTGAAAQPKLKVQLELTIVDDSGTRTGQVVKHDIPVKFTQENARSASATTDGAPLTQIDINDTVQGDMFFTVNGEKYEIVPEDNSDATIRIVDYYDEDKAQEFTKYAQVGESLLKLSEDGMAFDLRTSVVGQQTQSFDMSSYTTKWELDYNWHIPEPENLNSYLGGDAKADKEHNKFFDFKDKEVYANALVIVQVKAKVAPKDPPKADFDVPQWRLTEYYEDISPKEKRRATYGLTFPAQTWIEPTLSPNGNVTFQLISPDLNEVRWAMSKAKLFNNDTATKDIDVFSSQANFILAGDLLAIKDNGSIGNVKLAAWHHALGLLDNRIGTAVEGKHEDKPLVTKEFNFVYKVKNPIDTYYYEETRYRTVCGWYSCWLEAYRAGGNATAAYEDTEYKVTVNFHRYIPKATVATKVFGEEQKSDNGMYWESYQDTSKVRVNPEVWMAHDDESGRTSISFAAGDRMREIQPVHYNSAKFVDTVIVPKVDGLSVATDQQAKQLASKLGAGGVGVIYKGAATTQHFDVKGQLLLKTYALDISNTAMKNAWGNADYSTDDINREYLERYATEQEDGTWNINLEALGSLKVNNKDYAGVKDTIEVEQKEQTVVEHKIVVRGGVLLSVDGETDFTKLDPELKNAIDRMKLTGKHGENVFNTFERAQGAKLTEDDVVALANTSRGTKDVAKGTGWYNEDTTLLIIREYTNVYDLPSYMYADKLPMEIQGLQTPINKAKFFDTGYLGHTKLRFGLVDAYAEYDSSLKDPFGGKYSIDYVVPNVSVLDTFQ